MPCPFFEPVAVARNPRFADGRLPLIEEYDGLCLAGSSRFAAPEALRHSCCNNGYSAGCCEHFPREFDHSALRYSVVARTPQSLEVVCIEEQDFTPKRLHRLHFCRASGALSGLPPERPALTAQALAFCRSYLRRFPG